MPPLSLSRYELAVVASVSVAGAAVAGAAALAHSLGTPEPEPSPPRPDGAADELTFSVPPMPKTRDELETAVAENYMSCKDHLSKIFRAVGQVLVAPIVVSGIDAAYSLYTDHCKASSPSSKTVAHSGIPADVRARAVVGGCPVL